LSIVVQFRKFRSNKERNLQDFKKINNEKIFFCSFQNRQFKFSAKIPYDLVAERSEATAENLQFPVWCVCLTKSEHFLNGTDRRASRLRQGFGGQARAKPNARAGPIAKPSACYGASKKEEFLFTP